uniref:Transmembrane and immunoglobulin domain containing 1 n=1 Tax=Scleropages formosus TaxID=113540 RepID=A0A8C9R7W9_SCLFO
MNFPHTCICWVFRSLIGLFKLWSCGPYGRKIDFKIILLNICYHKKLALRVESSPPAYGGVISIEAEKTVSLTCLLESSSLVDRELQWFRNGAQIHLQEWNRLNQSSLCLNPVSQDDDGVTFKCQLNSNAAANASVQLEVFCVDNITIEEGGKISLACDIYANPQVTVTWKQNDKALDLASGGYELFHNTWESRLSISKVQREIHEGQYSCVVTSPKFGIRTKIFSLTVEGLFYRNLISFKLCYSYNRL